MSPPRKNYPQWRTLKSRLIAIYAFGLLAFLLALLLLGQTRAGLTAAYQQSLGVQANIMAEALGGLEPVIGQMGDAAGGGAGGDNAANDDNNFMMPMLDVEAAKPLLRRLVAPTKNRVRLYDHTGVLLIDTAALSRHVQIAEISELDGDALDNTAAQMPDNNDALEEVRAALDGQISSSERRDAAGRDVLTLAVPVQYYRAISGVLLVTSPPGTIDALVAVERRATIRIFLAVFVIVGGLTVLLARTITGPVSHLAQAMRQVLRAGGTGDASVPDYTGRGDEIGDLSRALQDMLARLHARIDTIERFAADVSHELKNPLASLNSAVQTLETVKKADQAPLFEILKADIQRMNKLISDISDASRLDAELSRGTAQDFDLTALMRNTVQVYADAYQLDLKIEIAAAQAFMVHGQDSRIAQIFNNLLDNAVDFAPQGSVLRVGVALSDNGENAEVSFSDAGVGIVTDEEGGADMRERIFERFYTDRKHDVSRQAGSRAKHSGLGLSISRQIAWAHGGDLTAGKSVQGGACFTLSLPLNLPLNLPANPSTKGG